MSRPLSVRGRPIHVLLVPFPVALLLGTFAADLVGVMRGIEDLWVTARYLGAVGLVAGAIAAVPGFADGIRLGRGGRPVRGITALHAILNLTALLLFLLAWIVRGGPGVEPEHIIVGAEGVGAVLLLVSAWIGIAVIRPRLSSTAEE
jgi:uncharacterized membrane protein